MAKKADTNKNEKIQLILKDVTIHSLKDLRENFDAETILKAHIDGTLTVWLTQHYYEKEAAAVSDISFEQPNCIRKLCTALGIDDTDHQNMSEEEKEKLDAKRRKVSEFTNDSKILSEAYLVAFHQEEMAELLDRGEHKIYLCKESFSIPIHVPGIEYICIGNATIEHPYTSEQYAKAGIKVSGFPLPASVDSEAAATAKKAAAANGYDDFHENHTPLATMFHNALKARRLINTHHISYNSSLASKFFNSKHECEEARDQCIRKAYDEATKYLTTGSSRSLSKEAAEFYDEIIEKSFSTLTSKLETLSRLNDAVDAYQILLKKIEHARKNLQLKFDQELDENSDYYTMYDFDYFTEQVAIEKHDYRMSNDFFTKALETLFTDNVQYTITDIYSPIREIEDDLDRYANTFFGSAFQSYQTYIGEIEALLDTIGKGLPESLQNETAEDYIMRCCVKKAG